jgi:hypothetical protein
MIPTPETLSFETSRIGRRVLGVPPPDEELDPNDPRRLVAEFIARVKSPQKYWNHTDGPEPILQLRAAVLSEDDRLEQFLARRPGNPYRSRKAA